MTSIRIRLTLLAAAATTVAVLVAGWLLVRSAEDTQLDRIRARAEESVGLVVQRLDAGDAWEAALSDLPSAVFVADDTGGCIASNPGGGQLLFRCAADLAPGEGPFPIPPPGATVGRDVVAAPPDEVAGRVDEVSLEGRTSSADGPVFGAQVVEGAVDTIIRRVDTDAYGTLVVTAITPGDSVARGIDSVGWIVWVVLPGLVVLVAVLTWWMAGQTLKPVESIRAQAASIGAGNLDARVPEPRSADEIGRLARTMNAMLDRLERAKHQQQQFVSDASHEMRSPVAAIRTDLEVALAEGDRADWQRTARAVLAEDARLEALIDDLLILSAADEVGERTAERSATVEIEPLVAEEVARRRAVPVVMRVVGDPGALAVAGVGIELQRALAHLLDNGCRYAATTVEVTLEARVPNVVIAIDDDGPGIPVADRARVFERFTRLDEGRARGRGGTGLGLAVCRAIVTAGGGTVSVGDSDLGGARFTIEFPLAAADDSARASGDA